MRPLLLEMEAFGSYPGKEVVDFTVLGARGLFVVTGETGTGKTTIFDAMSYALFGEMPSKSAAEIRSHHAPADRRAYARFTFEVDGVCYVVDRSPEFERPKERGQGTTKEAAKVSLVRVDEGGGSTSLGTRTREVGEKIGEIVGLSASQFQKVVLLPQGEFTAFLVAGSNDREELLMKLFGGEIYTHVIESLKQKSIALSAQVADVTRSATERLGQAIAHVQRVDECLTLEPPADYAALTSGEVRALLERANSPLAECAEQAKRVADAAGAKALEAQALVDAAKRFHDAAGFRERLASLELARASVEADEAAAKRSADARAVVNAGDRAASAAAAVDEAIVERDARIGSVLDTLSPLGLTPATDSAVQLTAAIAAEQAKVVAQQAVLAQLAEARAKHDDGASQVHASEQRIAELQAEQTVATGRVAAIDEALAAIEPVDISALEVALTVATQRIAHHASLTDAGAQLAKASAREVEARAVHDELLQRFVATQAPRLAASLVPGEPCAVCGSAEHPQPAVHPEGDPVDFEQVDAAAGTLRIRATAREAAAAELERCRSELGEAADRSLTELEVERVQASSALDAGRTTNEAAGRLATERSAVEQQATQMALDLATVGGTLASQRALLAEAVASMAAATAAAEDLDADAVARADSVLTAAAKHGAALHDLFAAVGTASVLAKTRNDELEAALAARPFADVDAARAVLLDAAVEAAQLAAAEQHRSAVTSVTASLSVLEQQGIPDEAPDTAQAQIEADALAEERDRVAALNTKASTAHGDGKAAIELHDSIVADSAALIAQRDDALKASTVCSKGGPLYMSLQRWVLARELDRVTAAANVHLARMTASRYTLRRVIEVQNRAMANGLNLEVLDGDTGRPRSTTSLSGGEQFQASLALALGLADVVSLGGKGSGRRFEALFIDEGFGTLDDKALDHAIETLYHLQATGRMVGAITHVEGMKQRLHPGIVVTRRPDGGGSTLTVNP